MAKSIQEQLQETYLQMNGILSAEDKQIVEGILALDELSKDTLGSFIKLASHDAAKKIQKASGAGRDSTPAEKAQSDKDFNKGLKRLRGVVNATDKLTKEQKETIGSVLEELQEDNS